MQGFLVFIFRNLEDEEKCIEKFKDIFSMATDRLKLKDDKEPTLLLLLLLIPDQIVKNGLIIRENKKNTHGYHK